MGLPSFVDHVTLHTYGVTGGFLLIAPQHQLIVTATDKRRVMTHIPMPGTIPAIVRFMDGYEGWAVYQGPLGVEVLASAKRIPAVDWMLGANMLTEEAFAPIHQMQHRLLTAASFLTLMAGALIWWLLRRQLAPMVAAAHTLAQRSTTRQPLEPLVVARHDEVGELIGGFNHLLATLGQREEAIRESEVRFRTIFEMSPDAIVLHRAGKLVFVNPAAVTTFGAKSENDLIGRPIVELIAPDFLPVALARMQTSAQTGKPAPTLEGRYLKLDGTIFYAEVQGMARHLEGHLTVITTFHDVTERKRVEGVLQQSVKDKHALLMEVHHRVKNNLQVIISLLRMEAGRSASADTQSVLGAMQGRIRSMALLHESLYRSDTFAAVDLGAYLSQLATQAFKTQVVDSDQVQLQLKLQSVDVSMDQAISAGLLVNELISNALKHGFPAGRRGQVCIDLLPANPQDPMGDTAWRLCVRDNGVGLPSDFETLRQATLGLQLVDDLSQQIGGSLVIESKPDAGAVFSVVFKVLEPAPLVMPL